MTGETILHYKITEKIGAGGMGVVYKAEDTKLKRTVALKFLPEQISLDKNAKERFMVEAQAAAALNHPNIATIFAIEEEDGKLFIVMEYVDGNTLKHKMETDPVMLSEVFDLGKQIAEGLHEAHKNGVTHRDIKPSNVMITATGVAKIMDFGLAKITENPLITRDGTTLGTAAYMSPEQARGEKVDHRTDIWSFGVVLYEVMCGQRPFKGEYEQAVMYSIMNTEHEPVSEKLDGLPEGTDTFFAKMFRKDPQERVRTFKEVIEDLGKLKEGTSQVVSTIRSVIKTKPDSKSTHVTVKLERSISKKALYAATAIVGVIIVAGYFLVAPLLTGGGTDEIDSIAILPFLNQSGAEEAEYLSDGIPESIISSLQKLKGIKVISFNSVLKKYKGQIPEASEVGSEFNVKAVALGRLMLSGDDITVSIEIVDTRDNSVLFSDRYIKKITDLIALQDEIAGDVLENLSDALTGEVQRETIKLTATDPEAYRNMLLANQFVSKRTVDDFYQALDYLDRAIELDPGYAMAYAVKSIIYSILPVYEFTYSEEYNQNAKSAVQRALDLDPGLSEAHSALGEIYTNELKWEEALIEYETAKELNVNNATAYVNLGWASLALREFEEAKLQFEKALELDPLNISPNRALGLAYYLLEDHDNALLYLNKAVELDPKGFFQLRDIFSFYLGTGRYKEAAETQKELFKSAGIPEAESVFDDVFSEEIYSKDTLIKYQDEIFNNTEALSILPYNNSTFMWIIMMQRNDFEKGFEYLDIALENKDYILKYYIAVNNKFSELMEYPRYREVLRIMGMDTYIK